MKELGAAMMRRKGSLEAETSPVALANEGQESGDSAKGVPGLSQDEDAGGNAKEYTQSRTRARLSVAGR